MAPAGSTCKEVHEPYTAVADYSVVISKQETNSTPAKSSIVSLGQRGIRSNAGVDALLECPVCTNLMYSPIYQVSMPLVFPSFFCNCFCIFSLPTGV